MNYVISISNDENDTKIQDSNSLPNCEKKRFEFSSTNTFQNIIEFVVEKYTDRRQVNYYQIT